MTFGSGATAPYLYLPIEISSRELDAKLLLAQRAAALGLEVILGQKWLMQRNIPHMPPGIILFKTLTTRDAKYMRRARDLGYRIVAMDEEVPGLLTRHEKLRWVSPDAIALSDLILAAGDEHGDTLVARFPAARDKIVVVGNPRWDLLRPEFLASDDSEVQDLRRRYGRFILINTNLGFINCAKGSTEWMIRNLERAHKIDRRQPADAAFVDDHVRQQQAGLEGLTDLLRRLPAAFPRHKIILRPHPSEKLSTWEAIAEGLPRTEIVRQGAAIPWVRAADLLIHTYCTTGVEAYALRRPALCFLPIRTAIVDNYLSPSINPVVTSVEDVVRQARAIVAAGPDGYAYPPAYRAVFDRSIAGFDGARAADRITSALTQRFCIDQGAPEAVATWQPGPRFARRIFSKAHNLGLMPLLTTDDVTAGMRRLAGLTRSPMPDSILRCGDRMFHIGRPPRRPAAVRYDNPSPHLLARLLRRFA